MKVLIISDSHKRLENLNKIMEKEKKADLLIHCGDAECNDDEIRAIAKCPLHIVSGNNDFFYNYAKELQISIKGRRVFITHGHYYYVSMGTEMLAGEARARNMDIVMFGHTHRPYLSVSSDLVILNPGSISYPRQEGKRPSYAVMNIEDSGEPDFRICYL